MGKWGGVNRELVATREGALYRMHCLDIRISDAPLLEVRGSFAGSGMVAIGPIAGRPATIRVTLRGDTAFVGYTVQRADSSYLNALSPPDTLISGQGWIEGHRDCPV